MKLLIIMALISSSLMAFGQHTRTHDQEAESASRRLLQKKREKTNVTPVKPQEEEVRVNEDHDMKLDPLDPETNRNEGTNDD